MFTAIRVPHILQCQAVTLASPSITFDIEDAEIEEIEDAEIDETGLSKDDTTISGYIDIELFVL